MIKIFSFVFWELDTFSWTDPYDRWAPVCPSFLTFFLRMRENLNQDWTQAYYMRSNEVTPRPQQWLHEGVKRKSPLLCHPRLNPGRPAYSQAPCHLSYCAQLILLLVLWIDQNFNRLIENISSINQISVELNYYRKMWEKYWQWCFINF